MKKADWILIISLLVVTVILAVVVLITKLQNTTSASVTVVIEVDGEIYKEIFLSQDGRYTIETKDGNSILVISHGECYMESAYCPDQICVKHKPISAVGDSIICLPYRIVVSLVGSEEPQFDN